jgi:hypothetical protein
VANNYATTNARRPRRIVWKAWGSILNLGEETMKTSKSPLLIAAAFTGLLGGAMARANAAPNSPQTPGAQSDSTAKPEKHACAGKNSCAGKGGCATDGSKKNKADVSTATERHACAGKNSCSGKGGCATDGKAKKKS